MSASAQVLIPACVLALDSLVFYGGTLAYGWLVRYRVPLAVPLIVQFIRTSSILHRNSSSHADDRGYTVGFTILSVMQLNQVMLIDLVSNDLLFESLVDSSLIRCGNQFPGKGASITATVCPTFLLCGYGVY